jgi:GTP 3',8-cyclase
MARRDFFAKTWSGIEEAERVGLRPIKLNVVLVRGINDGEILRFAELARSRAFVVRFIEFMPLGKDDGWANDRVVTTREVLERIRGRYALLPLPVNGLKAPADRYGFENGRGEVGFISSVSEPFCGNCDRIRVTSDGKLRTCLFSLQETDLRTLLRGGAQDEEIAETIAGAVWNKEEGHLINRPGFVRPERTMSQIGG